VPWQPWRAHVSWGSKRAARCAGPQRVLTPSRVRAPPAHHCTRRVLQVVGCALLLACGIFLVKNQQGNGGSAGNVRPCCGSVACTQRAVGTHRAAQPRAASARRCPARGCQSAHRMMFLVPGCVPAPTRRPCVPGPTSIRRTPRGLLRWRHPCECGQPDGEWRSPAHTRWWHQRRWRLAVFHQPFCFADAAWLCASVHVCT